MNPAEPGFAEQVEWYTNLKAETIGMSLSVQEDEARMRHKRQILIMVLFAFCLILSSCYSHRFPEIKSASGQNGVVVSSHPIASRIGLSLLKSGGNAIDAAVATGLALGVVDQFNSGIGGGGFIVIRMADGTVYAIDGREKAPAAATSDMYVREGEYDPELSRAGPMAVGVPGILAAYVQALELAGTKPLAELIAPSINVAEKGFELDAYYLSRYNGALEKLKKDPASSKIYLHPDGSSFKEGDTLKQHDLAETYRNIARGGLDYFYRGEFAEKMASYMSESGGLITYEDMINYAAKLREPITGEYRGYEIIGMPPPSSGGVHVVEILNMLETCGMLEGKPSWDWNSVYWTTQFMRKAFEDRVFRLGDSDFYPVPVERLTSKAYAESLVTAIMSRDDELRSGGNRLQEAGKFVLRGLHGGWKGKHHDPFLASMSGHTTNFVIIDRWGNAVSVNQTVNLTYGAKITLPGTGIILNNEMDDFSAQPGVPNAFGLVGSEANAIEAGKRPLSSMSPTIVVSKKAFRENGSTGKDRKPILILGGAGGPKIITAVLLTIVGIVDFDQEVSNALVQPRFHHQYKPDVLFMEEHTSRWMQLGQWLKGQNIELRRELGRIQAIAWNDNKQSYVGAADPRSKGSAVAY